MEENVHERFLAGGKAGRRDLLDCVQGKKKRGRMLLRPEAGQNGRTILQRERKCTELDSHFGLNKAPKCDRIQRGLPGRLQ